MKRIAAILLLAGLGTGCATTDSGKAGVKTFNASSTGQTVPGVVGPTGEPVLAARNANNSVVQASGTMDPNVQQTAGFARVTGAGCSTCDANTGVHMPGVFNSSTCSNCAPAGAGGHGAAYMGPGFNGGTGHGVIPAPQMGPPGAVPAFGAIGPGMGIPMASNMRTAIRFVSPTNAKVTWFSNGSYAEPGLAMPAEYNFAQASIYRLKISGIPSKPGKVYYPTIDVAPATPKTITYLDHGTVPVSFTDEDLQRVDGGNLVIKVIYLPDSLYQDVTALGNAEELVSTQLEPGTDPVVEANRRGTVLAIIRLGNINLENPNSPAKDAPPPSMVPPAGPNMTPGAMQGAMSPSMVPTTMQPISIPAVKTGSR